MAPTPVFLPGESHEQRILASYSLWGCKESDITEATWHACMKDIEYIVPCAIQDRELYINPRLLIYLPPPPTIPSGNHKFAFYVCESISVL